ncbi:MAG: hypothetical protein A3F72_01860 [Bacteroidetes bacterium RIFCSPLOWO2_12_FULL_35_15]|nr:MAG: hypothetical protein A3F72_01860 [Bacteroidetes bacterium RIFCSPLOWO2_12_FULL_35_15]
MKKIKLIISLCIASNFIFISKIISQNFNYSLTKDSSSYNELINPLMVSANENYQNKNFIIHLPFHYNFCGSVCDSLRIESNGFIVFDKSKGLSSIAFNNFNSKKDSFGNFVSTIAYITEGASGNRILKIQIKNIAQAIYNATDYLNYQVWLYENENKIAYHIGPNYLSTVPEPIFPPEIPEEERIRMEVQNPVLLGLINRNMDTTNKAYLIKGKPSTPSGLLITGETELGYLNNIPKSGTIYTLTPTF